MRQIVERRSSVALGLLVAEQLDEKRNRPCLDDSFLVDWLGGETPDGARGVLLGHWAALLQQVHQMMRIVMEYVIMLISVWQEMMQ